MGKKLILFDSDNTLWHSGDDYVSSVQSEWQRVNANAVRRVTDKKVFTLHPSVRKAFQYINKQEGVIGIVSDNKAEPVKNILQLFNLWNLVDPDAFAVRLWQGPCPKEKLIEEIVNKPKFKYILRNNIYLLDDKDYSLEAKELGIIFIRVSENSDLAQLVNDICYR